MSDKTKNLFGCLLWIMIAVFIYKGCDWYSQYKKENAKAEYNEKMKNDSIRKAFIKDSLAHDPHYQDSIRIEEEKYQKWKLEHDSISNEEIVGFVLDGDSVYHSTFHSMEIRNDYNFSIYDMLNLRFISRKEAEENQFKLCEECSDIYYAHSAYENGELIDIFDIDEYVKDNSEDFEDLFEYLKEERFDD